MPQPPPCTHVALWLGFWGWKGAEGWGGAKISPGSFFSRLRLERGSQKLTAVQGQVARGRGRPIEYCSVQEVDGGLGVNDLEDLAEQGAQLLRRHLGEGEGERGGVWGSTRALHPELGRAPRGAAPLPHPQCDLRLILELWVIFLEPYFVLRGQHHQAASLHGHHAALRQRARRQRLGALGAEALAGGDAGVLS